MSLTSKVMAGFGEEDREHFAVVQWCDSEGIPVFHVPNSTYTKMPMVMVRNKLLGVRRGVPDLFAMPGGHLVAIEMKSASGTASREQKNWLALLNAAGIPAIVSKTREPAIEFLKHYRDNPKPAGEAITTATELGKRYHTLNDDVRSGRKKITLKPTDGESPF